MTTDSKPVPGSPEYDAAMAAKAETSGVIATHTDAKGNQTTVEGSPPPATSEQPKDGELILGKFKTQADLEAAYKELEGKLGKPKADEQKPAEGEQKPAEGEAPSFQALSEKATQELTESGTLTDETYAGFEKVGVTRAQLDTYVQGIKAISEQRVSAVYAEAGGKEQYAAMVAWAGSALSPAEVAAFDAAALGDDDGARLNAVRGLVARYAAENGRGGNLVKPRATTDGLTGDAFRSKAELTAAMRDPKYKTDPAYRSDVERKILNAENAGIDLGL